MQLLFGPTWIQYRVDCSLATAAFHLALQRPPFFVFAERVEGQNASASIALLPVGFRVLGRNAKKAKPESFRSHGFMIGESRRPFLERQVGVFVMNVTTFLARPAGCFKSRLRINQLCSDVKRSQFPAFQTNEPNPNIVDLDSFNSGKSGSVLCFASGHGGHLQATAAGSETKKAPGVSHSWLATNSPGRSIFCRIWRSRKGACGRRRIREPAG